MSYECFVVLDRTIIRTWYFVYTRPGAYSWTKLPNPADNGDLVVNRDLPLNASTTVLHLFISYQSLINCLQHNLMFLIHNLLRIEIDSSTLKLQQELFVLSVNQRTIKLNYIHVYNYS